MRSLGLESKKEWKEWSKSGKRPHDVPSNPDKTYHDEGWVSYPDWLGYGVGRLPRNVFLPFEEAREYARSLQLKGVKEWKEWCASGKLPDDGSVPSAPHNTYRDEGWEGYRDWLGY